MDAEKSFWQLIDEMVFQVPPYIARLMDAMLERHARETPEILQPLFDRTARHVASVVVSMLDPGERRNLLTAYKDTHRDHGSFENWVVTTPWHALDTLERAMGGQRLNRMPASIRTDEIVVAIKRVGDYRNHVSHQGSVPDSIKGVTPFALMVEWLTTAAPVLRMRLCTGVHTCRVGLDELEHYFNEHRGPGRPRLRVRRVSKGAPLPIHEHAFILVESEDCSALDDSRESGAGWLIDLHPFVARVKELEGSSSEVHLGMLASESVKSGKITGAVYHVGKEHPQNMRCITGETNADSFRVSHDWIEARGRISLELRRRLEDAGLDVIGLAGAGAFGTVVRARKRGSGGGEEGADVAVKVLHPGVQVAGSEISRLRREIELMKGQSLPHVVRYFADSPYVSLEGDHIWFSMEYVDGETLTRWIEHGKYEDADAIDVAGAVIRGVAALHRKGVIHRDLRPENIMRRRNGEVVIVDLGLAKIPPRLVGEMRSYSMWHRGLGQAPFAPREQLHPWGRHNPHRPDARVDVHAIGWTILCLLNRRNIAAEVPDDSTEPLWKNVPARLSAILQRCVSSDPEARPRDAIELERFWNNTVDDRTEFRVGIVLPDGAVAIGESPFPGVLDALQSVSAPPLLTEAWSIRLSGSRGDASVIREAMFSLADLGIRVAPVVGADDMDDADLVLTVARQRGGEVLKVSQPEAWPLPARLRFVAESLSLLRAVELVPHHIAISPEHVVVSDAGRLTVLAVTMSRDGQSTQALRGEVLSIVRRSAANGCEARVETCIAEPVLGGTAASPGLLWDATATVAMAAKMIAAGEMERRDATLSSQPFTALQVSRHLEALANTLETDAFEVWCEDRSEAWLEHLHDEFEAARDRHMQEEQDARERFYVEEEQREHSHHEEQSMLRREHDEREAERRAQHEAALDRGESVGEFKVIDFDEKKFEERNFKWDPFVDDLDAFVAARSGTRPRAQVEVRLGDIPVGNEVVRADRERGWDDPPTRLGQMIDDLARRPGDVFARRARLERADGLVWLAATLAFGQRVDQCAEILRSVAATTPVWRPRVQVVELLRLYADVAIDGRGRFLLPVSEARQLADLMGSICEGVGWSGDAIPADDSIAALEQQLYDCLRHVIGGIRVGFVKAEDGGDRERVVIQRLKQRFEAPAQFIRRGTLAGAYQWPQRVELGARGNLRCFVGDPPVTRLQPHEI